MPNLIGTAILLLIGTDLNPTEIEGMLRNGLDHAYVENFDSAGFFFKTVINGNPDNPAGYFFYGALLQFKMMDECHYDHEQEYLLLMDQAEKTACRILDKEQNQWAEFYLGSVYTYRAVYEGYKKNYFETFRYGVKGGAILQSMIKQDSTFYDAYLGAGTYEYFWVRAARYLPVLKLTGGNLEKAIHKITIAAQLSKYSAPTALNSLVFIYSEEKQYAAADSVIGTLLNKYPGSRTFLWNKADLAFKKNDFVNALEAYNDLFDRYHDYDPPNYSNLAQCKLQIGKCLLKLGEKALAINSWKEVIAYKQYGDRYPKIKDYCREAYALLSRNL